MKQGAVSRSHSGSPMARAASSAQQKPDGSAQGDGRPTLLEAFQARNGFSTRETPDILNDVNQKLNIDTSDDEQADSFITEVSSMDDAESKPRIRGLPLSTLPTGLCYDERMRFHAEVSATTGDTVHPEDPRRIYYIYKELCEAGLVADAGDKMPTLIDPPLFRIDAREATKEECCLVHTDRHYEFVRRTAGKLWLLTTLARNLLHKP